MPTKSFYLFIGLFHFIIGSVFGQLYPSDDGNFSVDKIEGCAPLQVNIVSTVAPSDVPVVYNFDYEPGDRIDVNESTELDTTYNEPGTYEILQVIGYTTGGVTSTIRIEVLEPRTPQFQLINCPGDRVVVQNNDNYYDRLEIDYGDGSPVETVPVTIRTVPPHRYSTTDTYNVTVRGILDNADDSSCGDSTATITTIQELEFSPPTLSEVEVLDGQRIRVAYSLPNPNVTYQIQVNENGEGSARSYPLEAGSSELIIEQNEWNTRENYYCISVSAINICSENVPSNELCTITLSGSAENQQNDLSWQTQADLFDQYQIIRDEAPLVTSVPTEYSDNDVVCQQTYDYQIVASDGAGTSLSEEISLTAINTANPAAITDLLPGLQELSTTLTWPEVTEAQQYYIYREQGDSLMVLYDSIAPDQPELLYVDDNVEIDQEYCYQVSYLDECGNEAELSNEVCQRVPSQAQVYFPNAFTPNGDGLNDVFLYRAALVESVTFEVYNRWGELLFRTDQLDVGWDGTYNGTIASQGTYLYKISVRDQLGNDFVQHGKVVLLNPGSP